MSDAKLTEGNVAKALFAFTMPLVMSGLFQQLFSWVDAFIVGNWNGEEALAGIGATTSVYNLFVTIITGFSAGLSVLVAQCFGKGDEKEARSLLSSFALLFAFIFTLIGLIGSFCASELLALMDTPDVIYGIASDYLSVILLGVPFLALYNVFSAVLRGIGNSRTPFTSILVSSSVNVVLDLVFVIRFGMGASGAAIATVISQAAMAVYLIIYTIARYPRLRFRPSPDCISLSSLRKGAVFGLPPAIQSGAVSIGSVILQQFMNGFGEQTVAAITTAYRVDTVILLPITNLGAGIATAVGQNAGAGKKERMAGVIRAGILIMIVVSLLLTLFVFLFGGPLISLFGLTEETTAIGRSFFSTIAAFYIVFGLSTALRGYIEGIGDMLFSGIAGILSLAVRIASSYAFAGLFGNMVIAYAEIIAWIFLLIIVAVRFCRIRTGKARKPRGLPAA